jgi:hypothetical protein
VDGFFTATAKLIARPLIASLGFVLADAMGPSSMDGPFDECAFVESVLRGHRVHCGLSLERWSHLRGSATHDLNLRRSEQLRWDTTNRYMARIVTESH